MQTPEQENPRLHRYPDTSDPDVAKKASYGLDAPPIVYGFGIGGLVLLAAGLMLQEAAAIVSGAFGSLTAALMLHSSFRGKLRERDRLLSGLALQGDERVLDLGCGRGLLMVGAAKRLPQGEALGVDLWRQGDLGRNSREATLANAAREGVSDRVQVIDADMRELPLGDESVDAVTASMSIHNISSKASRAEALREATRVLRRGGRIALLDFKHTGEYLEVLGGLGFDDLRRSGYRMEMWPPVRVVTGRKSQSQGEAASRLAG
jgi:arsenite methyltransferase